MQNNTAPGEAQTTGPFKWPMLKRDDLIFLASKFEEVCYIVECTQHEQFFLWSQWAKGSQWPYDHKKTLDWQDHRSGYMVKVGEVSIESIAYPVNIEIRPQVIDSAVLLFFHPISLVVHWDLIKTWWANNFPLWYDRRPAYCNAMNFNHALDVINDLNKEASDAN